MATTRKKWRLIVVSALAALVGLVFVRQGVMKFDPGAFWTGAFERWGYPVWFRYTIGVLETAGGALLLVPRFTTYAATILTAIMVGAFFTRLGDGRTNDLVAIGVYMALLAWFAYERRNRRWRAARIES
jgi:putative oxidoreductase